MKNCLGLTVCCAIASTASAVMAPQYENARDLDVLVAFVRQHPRVMASLKAIDLQRRSVVFGENCTARFERVRRDMPSGHVGPAAPLQFVYADCPID